MAPFLPSRLRHSLRRAGCALLACGVLLAAAFAEMRPERVNTNPLNKTSAVREAYEHYYSLDYPAAIARFEKIASDHPDDPMAVDYLLNATLFSHLYALNLLDTTLYAHDGFLTGRHPVHEDKAVTEQINALADKAVKLAYDRLHTNPDDVNALYARAWARSMRAIYMGLVQHSYISGLRQALAARSDDDRVLEIDPDYVDAELVVGVHNYVFGALPFGFKVMAGLAGIHGDKQRGIAILRDDAHRGVTTSVEARSALLLFLRREGKYAEAEQLARTLTEQHPHNFLFALEAGNLRKDSGDAAGAIAQYRAVLDNARKPGFYPSAHLELACFALGETLRGQRDYAGAAEAFNAALRQPSISPELKRRTELALGKAYDQMQQREKAMVQYQKVLTEGPDPGQAAEARRALLSPFGG